MQMYKGLVKQFIALPWIKILLLLLFILDSSITAASSSDTKSSEISYDLSPFAIVYKNGTVRRLLAADVVPSLDPTGRVLSRDIYIDRIHGISARIFLPAKADPRRKLPLLVYFHGGAFFIGSPFSPEYHRFMSSLVAEARAVAVSVNYRLAPENPLPIGYEDAWFALKWALSHGGRRRGGDTWLREYADFKRVYIGGDSAGGNIAHNVAIRAGVAGLNRRRGLDGMFLNCPHFWGVKPIGNESRNPVGVALMKSIWVHAYPNSTGFDDPASNPGLDPKLGRLGVKRVLVYVGEKDVLKDRGLAYAAALRRSKWGGVVRTVEVKGVGHVFNLQFPNTSKAEDMLEQLAWFVRLGGGSSRRSALLR